MTTQEDKELKYKQLPPTRTDFGYEWEKRSIRDVLESLLAYLERQDARAFMLDVYASNNHVYRNILIQFPWKNSFQVAENIFIQFDKDEGRQLSINRD